VRSPKIKLGVVLFPRKRPHMLTDAACKAAACPPDKARARFPDSGGLYLEVSPAGSKRWFLKYRKDGKEMRLALGSYPDVRLADVRTKQAELI
jgi:hypothetical protein